MAARANRDIDAIEAHFSGRAGQFNALQKLQMLGEDSDFEIAREGVERHNGEAGEQGGTAGEDGWHELGGKRYRIVRILEQCRLNPDTVSLMATTRIWLVVWMSAALLGAQETGHQPQGNQILGPGQPNGGPPAWVGEMFSFRNDPAADHDAWLRDLKAWRAERKTRMGFDDSEYRRPEFQWIRRNFISPQAMVEERTLFDVAQNRWTVDKYLDDLDQRYGGIDSVLLWPVYPNIGIDNRNQWDLARDLPGGIPALRKVVEDFHKRNVRVLFPTMAWDNGTRDPGAPQWEATAKLMAEIGVDGVNGDTFSGLPRAYRTASDKSGHPVAFEPEGAPAADEGLIWNNMSWAYWDFKFAPTASKQKWLESRHMPHISDRWARDKTDDLQNAFFNGMGYVSWENIWGIWNEVTERDAEALRRVANVERAFASALASPDWEPFVPVIQYGVYASKFPGNGQTLYTFVNRNEYRVDGPQMTLPEVKGREYFDVWNGVKLSPTLSFAMEAKGYGAVLVVDGAEPADMESGDWEAFLAKRRELTQKPLSAYSHDWHFLPQKIVEMAATGRRHDPSEGMIRIPAGDFEFDVKGVEIEGDNWVGLDVQYPWEDSPRRSHSHKLKVAAFDIDRCPVTNNEFKKFLNASHYRPADDHNFLRDWKEGAPPAGWENKPVTWVSLEDARAYAQWAGKRLPHEWEWQYAAQGTDGRLYPWGSHWEDSAVPKPDKGRDLSGPDDVTAHPGGASPFGVMDMVGDVWQWTDEFVDTHTRAAILRGGSYYQPQGSIWYFPETYKLNEHGKYLLMAPSKDRAGTLGFRCVRDVE
jgi:formylglycine-generating enzyme required for sulfatase activity